MYTFAKYGLLPGTIGFLLFGLLLALAAAYRPKLRRSALALAMATVLAYWFMSMPLGAWLIGRAVSSGYVPIDESALKGVVALVVLDSGTARYIYGNEELAVVDRVSAVRGLEAVRLYRAFQPDLVVVSAGTFFPRGTVPEGGALRNLLTSAGIPSERIELDTASRNTREHAVNVSGRLERKGIRRFALVTSAVHMRRAMHAFSATGIQAMPAPAPLEKPGPYPWWPSAPALARSYEALYQVFGLLGDRVLSR